MTGIAAYQQTAKQHASKQQIVLMLYREAWKRLDRAEEQLREDPRGGDWIGDLAHAREILIELRGALDPQAAPELCARLGPLYDWGIHQLVEAGRIRDARTVAQVKETVSTLIDGWTVAVHGGGG